MAPASSKEFLDIQATVECGFTVKVVRDMLKTYNQMHLTDKYSQHSSIILPSWLNGCVFVDELGDCGSSPVAVTYSSAMARASRKQFLDIQATVESGFTVKLVRDMIKTCNQMHRTDKYSQDS